MGKPIDDGRGSSAYATGGGGVTLEQSFGASVLVALLLGDPVSGLGDDVRVERVHVQAATVSPIDDFVVTGENRTIAFAVRRDPTIAASDPKFVKLLAGYVRILVERAAEVDADRWRLGLVVAGPHTAASETRRLADVARRHPSSDSLRAEVERKGSMTAAVRARLALVDAAIDEATALTGLGGPTVDRATLTWRLLRALYIVESRLEGDVAQDRTYAIARLASSTKTLTEAESLYEHLCRLVASTAVAGGVLDMASLRRDLRSVAVIDRATTYARAWELLDARSADLRARASPTLIDSRAGAPTRLHLERAELREQLRAFLRATGERGSLLVVGGEPYVGKSALTIQEAEELRQAGESVVTLSLRDLPGTAIELDGLLGAPFELVVGSMAVAPVRLLVLDGAEVVLEGRDKLVHAILRAARRVRVGVVTVTRDDAKDANVRAANQAGFDVEYFSVSVLADAEIDLVARAFPSMARAAEEPRARWLLGRLGLVEVLLSSGAQAVLPDGALSEADVFAAIWKTFIRRDEAVAPGEPAPDIREAALLGVIRRLLDPSASMVSVEALPSLRRDRVLLPFDAWRTGDEFASDLYRDFTAARLLLTDPSRSTLARAGAPRWMLRAARLAAQVRLISAGTNAERVRVALVTEFDALAIEHGQRWRDVAWEAVLTLGSARALLQDAVPRLLADGGAELAELLRVVVQRFCSGGRADAVVVGPVVELLCDQADAIDNCYSAQDHAEAVIHAWLAGLALDPRDTVSVPLRARVRNELFPPSDDAHSEFSVRSLGLLGPDLDTRVERELRKIGAEHPHLLQDCVDDAYVAHVMSRHQPDLLLALAELYYIEKQNPLSAWRDGPREGVRSHGSHGGFGDPMASFGYGPFWALLHSNRARETIKFIKRLLDHATRVRVTRGALDAATVELDDLPGVDIELHDGSARFIVDVNVWKWYRGTGVGPYPCISALLALERFVDQLLELPGMQFANVISMLLRDCESGAIPALVVGVLVRYIDRVDAEFDPWLSQPLFWWLENKRVMNEHVGGLYARDHRAEAAPGEARRRWYPHDIAGYLVAMAAAQGDVERLRALAEVGRKLISTAESDVAGRENDAESEESLLVARRWAAMLDLGNYRQTQKADGVEYAFVAPDDIAGALEPKNRDLGRGQEAWRLLSAYGLAARAPVSTELLRKDIAVARDLQGTPPDSGPDEVLFATAAVASAALERCAAGDLPLPEADRDWALATLERAATWQEDGPFRSAHSIHPDAPDRLAARRIAAVLVAPSTQIRDAQLAVVLASVDALMSSESEEVRVVLAHGLRLLWSTPCRVVGGSCVHATVFESCRRFVKTARSGPRDPGDPSRSSVPLDEPEAELPGVPGHDLRLNVLIPAIVVVTDCIASSCCVSGSARALRVALLDAHRRVEAYWSRRGYDEPLEEMALSVPGALLRLDDDEVFRHLDAFAAIPFALGGFLRGLRTVATVDARLRPAFRALWPRIMDTVLDLVAAGKDPREERHGGARAFAALIPVPNPPRGERNIDEAIRAAATGWPAIADIGARIERWVPLAAGRPESVEPLIAFLQLQPVAEQIRPGIGWIAAIAMADCRAIAGHSFSLPGWLQQLRESGLVDTEATRTFQRLVDGLAAAGDGRLMALQRALE